MFVAGIGIGIGIGCSCLSFLCLFFSYLDLITGSAAFGNVDVIVSELFDFILNNTCTMGCLSLALALALALASLYN